MKIRSILRDPFTYFRGSNPAFYEAATPYARAWMKNLDHYVWLHGDIHVGNVGTYQGPGQPGQDIHFGVVDPDDVVEGPFQLDLLHALTSVRMSYPAATPQEFSRSTRELCEGYSRGLTDPQAAEKLLHHPLVAALRKKASQNSARDYVSRYVTWEPSPRFRTARFKGRVVKDILEPLVPSVRTAIIDCLWQYLAGGCDAATRSAYRFKSREQLLDGILDVARWTRVESSGSQGVQKYLVLLDKPLIGDEQPLIIELKQEPPPSAARAGLLSAKSGSERAREVFVAHQLMVVPPPRLTGFTKMGEHGFLVRPRDPWAEEFEPDDFGRSEPGKAASAAAGLLGEVLGIAHCNSLKATQKSDRITLILGALTALPTELDRHSQEIAGELQRQYDSLRSDTDARNLASKADAFILTFQPQ